MWLINVQDYSLLEVNGPDDYPYAILSHTWDAAGEISFHDMTDLNVARAKGGWPKVIQTCALARGHGIAYAWIDTCSINKSNSAELTEAINSMFQWYKKASRCYAYLSDLPASPNGDPTSQRARDQLRADLGRCRWFSRGWTLQELIAPKVVEFYDSGWGYRGTKADLRYEITRITDVDVSVLSNSEELLTVPVARKMSWAAKRVTTRLEDTAYCLLGIFGVNMPLIYGEGAKAFIRLQEVIAQSTNDLSLFAWSEDEEKPSLPSYYGVLARSPQQFASCRRLELIADPLRHDTQFFTITNRGVEFQTSLKMDYANGDYLMHLYCRDAAVQLSKGRSSMIAIRLVKTSSGFARHCAGRISVDDDDTTISSANGASRSWDPFMRPVHVPEVITRAESVHLGRRFNEAFRFGVDAPPGVTWEMATHNPSLPRAGRDPASLRPSYWDPAMSVFLTESYQYFTGLLYITFSSRPEEPFAVLCGLMPRGIPLSTSKDVESSSSEAGVNAWLALHPPPCPWWKGGFAPSTHAEYQISQITDMHYPHLVARLGQTVRAMLSGGEALPSKAMMKYRKKGGPEEGSEVALPACYRLVSISGKTKKTGTERIHDVLISLREQIGPAEASRLWSVGAVDETGATNEP
ncbi:hypothetical protein MAPG_08698 [Magnaporthiopsis poae ATCC 64411]|uniref:Heterokaryon incompatibility domain-containing protein n=1 Tax=Magnaporthiopsis poae (strain ATCC 64411 / 73-15) TaxID=644358 RepID=A0A0C4E812_MAGP6|nr:hypothetical protein MAPG_08698 [Magnaporthiopsis poae ATCC 64411]